MDLLKFYPLTWHYNKYNNKLYCKGLSDKREYVKISINLSSTFLLTSIDKIDPNDLEEIKSNYNCESCKISDVSDNTLILRNPIINSRDNWISIDSDPYGKVTSFFEYNNINPYEPFIIKRYGVMDKYNLINENQIIKTDIKNNTNLLRRIFWDIEVVTPRKEFVYAKYIDNHIISISMILQSFNSEGIEEIKSYFIYWGSYDVKNQNFESIRFSNEADVIHKFFKIIDDFSPDRMYTFNGDSFDTPYIIERCNIHSIIPKNIKFISKRIKGRFQWETVKVFNTPDIEHFDIIRIMLKFYPGLPNYKLETIGNLFIGEGKTGLDIEEMFRSFYTQSEEGMESLANYSVKDSVLLMRLNKKLKFDDLLENVANSCGILTSEILDINDDILVDKCAYIVDPGSYNLSGEIVKNNFFTKIIQQVIYKDIHIYDYSIYYSIEMQRYENKFNYDISIKSLELPAKVKSNLYWSKYFIRGPEKTYINELITQNDNIIEMSDINLKSVGPVRDLLDGSLILINKYTHYLQLGKISFVARNLDGLIIKSGTSKVLKPTFKMALDYLDSVINYIFDQTNKIPEYQLEMGKLNDYLIETKLKDIDEYPNGSDKYILAYQFDQRISTWTKVKYYMTINGPILKDLYKGEELNISYYEKELNPIKKLLKYKK